MNRTNIIAIFGSAPLFELGEHVLSAYSLIEGDGAVVPCKEYGMVSALQFCKYGNDYEGWTYDVQVYKIVSIRGKEKTIELYPNLSILQAPENHLEKCHNRLNTKKIVKTMIEEQKKFGEHFDTSKFTL